MHEAPTAPTDASDGPAGSRRTAPGGPAGDPRQLWSAADASRPPRLLHRRDGILPTVAAALSVRGETFTCTAGRADQPPALHPLVQDFLDALPVAHRERHTGRCPEVILISRQLTHAEQSRSRRAQRKPLTSGEARKTLKHARITARRIREDGDPLHGTYAPPCRSCAELLAHLGVRPVDLAAEPTPTTG